MTSSSIAQVREKLDLCKDTYLGCSDQELDEIRQVQGVACLPELYQEIMHVMGKSGIDSTGILGGNASYEGLLNANIKEWMFEDLQRQKIAYPEDAFVFFEHQGYLFYFFRTKDCQPDPPIYIFEGPYCFYRVNSLSEFFLEELKNRTEPAHHRFDLAWLYDPQMDDFYSVASDFYHELLPIEAVIEMLKMELEGKSDGCTGEELARLQQTQNVACLPPVYRAFMLMAGKNNSSRIFYPYGNANWEDILMARKLLKLKPPDFLPQDIFICCSRDDSHICFFRTKNCHDDPPLFHFCRSSSWREGKVYKLADTLSQFFLQQLDPNGRQRGLREHARMGDSYSYNVEVDDFLYKTS